MLSEAMISHLLSVLRCLQRPMQSLPMPPPPHPRLLSLTARPPHLYLSLGLFLLFRLRVRMLSFAEHALTRSLVRCNLGRHRVVSYESLPSLSSISLFTFFLSQLYLTLFSPSCSELPPWRRFALWSILLLVMVQCRTWWTISVRFAPFSFQLIPFFFLLTLILFTSNCVVVFFSLSSNYGLLLFCRSSVLVAIVALWKFPRPGDSLRHCDGQIARPRHERRQNRLWPLVATRALSPPLFSYSFIVIYVNLFILQLTQHKLRAWCIE